MGPSKGASPLSGNRTHRENGYPDSFLNCRLQVRVLLGAWRLKRAFEGGYRAGAYTNDTAYLLDVLSDYREQVRSLLRLFSKVWDCEE
jgi:hypothetical protein